MKSYDFNVVKYVILGVFVMRSYDTTII